MSNREEVSAMDLRDRLAAGGLRALELAQRCLQRIDEREADVRAFVHLDSEYVRAQAEACDEYREAGNILGPLHGLPVALKDIIDTRDMPTENGTVLDAGRRPTRDAALVSRLRSAGAVIIGKTVTTELAYFSPGKTRNPHDAARTPGGSSSGSAAAVAAAMVPLAVGSQTTGSVIRPAAFCGTVGYKPSFGLIPRTGVLAQSTTLDTMGVFARTVEDVALLAEQLAGFEPGDPATSPRSDARLLDCALSDPPVTPLVAFVKQPVWELAEADTTEAFEELVAALGEQCDEVALPRSFDKANELQRIVHNAEMAKHYQRYARRGSERLSERLRGAIDEGLRILAYDYQLAVDWRAVLGAGLDELFDRYDFLVTPAAPGQAPVGHDSTGNPAFCALWTLAGVPTVTLPLADGADGMPIGIQLVGRYGDDARLLRNARWLTGHLAQAD